MIKRFDEVYCGWGTETIGGGIAGFEGYTRENAERVANRVREEMSASRKVIEIDVKVEQMANGNHRVVNRSSYESDFNYNAKF